jgi:hypothetical protein
MQRRSIVPALVVIIAVVLVAVLVAMRGSSKHAGKTLSPPVTDSCAQATDGLPAGAFVGTPCTPGTNPDAKPSKKKHHEAVVGP